MNRSIPIAFTFLLFTLLILWNQQTPADTRWPTYRRDQTRNGISPLRGGMSVVPKVLWAVDLGGRQTTAEQIQFSDLDGDSVEELLRVGRNYIACELLPGQEQWRIGDLPNPKIIGIYDFNRRGRQAILIESNDFRQTKSMVIDGHSGQAFELYQRQSVFGYRYRRANFLRDESGQQLMVVWDGWGNPGQGQQLHLYLWQFDALSNTPKQLLSIHGSGNIFGAQPLIADLEGDDSDELILKRIATNVTPRQPNLIFIGGISQSDIDSIHQVIDQVRSSLPEVEFLLAIGAFGTVDPRNPEAIGRVYSFF